MHRLITVDVIKISVKVSTWKIYFINVKIVMKNYEFYESRKEETAEEVQVPINS